MRIASLIPLLLSLGVSWAAAEKASHPLDYVTAESVLEHWKESARRVVDGEDATTTEKRAVAAAATVTLDERANVVLIDGDPVALDLMAELVKEVDVRPTQVHLKGAVLWVNLGNGQKRATDLLFGGGIGVPGVVDEWDGLLQGLDARPDAELISRPFVFTKAGEEAKVAIGAGDRTVEVDVTALVGEGKQVTLNTKTSLIKGAQVVAQNSKLTIPNGRIAGSPGIVEKLDNGDRAELMVFWTPTVIEGE